MVVAFVTRVAESRGHEISFEDAGAGFPVALINGYGGTAAEWREVGYVDQLAADQRRVLSIDCLGHGRSSAPHDWQQYTAPEVAQDLVRAMDAAQVERAALWGYSRGAWLAATVAAEYPERVAALVLGGCHSLFVAPDWSDEAWFQALLEGDWGVVEADFGMSEDDLRTFESNDPRALGAAGIGRQRSDYVLDPSLITASILVYCGGEDSPEVCEPVATALGVDLHVVGSGGHAEAFHDADKVLSLVLGHLEQTGI